MISLDQAFDDRQIWENLKMLSIQFSKIHEKIACLTTLLPATAFYAFMSITSMACFSTVMTPAATAQAPEAVATFRDWSVFVKDISNDRICFAATEAKNKQPTNVKHGDVFFLVASWRSGAATNQPSLMTGYPLKQSPEPVLRIGADRWEMYTSENEGFIERDSDETRLINAMRRGADMRVSAVSSRGTATSYVISLRGISAALDRVKTVCK